MFRNDRRSIGTKSPLNSRPRELSVRSNKFISKYDSLRKDSLPFLMTGQEKKGQIKHKKQATQQFVKRTHSNFTSERKFKKVTIPLKITIDRNEEYELLKKRNSYNVMKERYNRSLNRLKMNVLIKAAMEDLTFKEDQILFEKKLEKENRNNDYF